MRTEKMFQGEIVMEVLFEGMGLKLMSANGE